jgi:NhaP-type Na+/H+ or K+/H+ antiporter
MLPLMNLVGYKIQVKTCLFLAFAGLRGAVGLSLALILTVNEKIDKKVSTLILFYVAGMVVLTLFINGMTAGFVLRKLGLAIESPLSKKLMVEFLVEMDA